MRMVGARHDPYNRGHCAAASKGTTTTYFETYVLGVPRNSMLLKMVDENVLSV